MVHVFYVCILFYACYGFGLNDSPAGLAAYTWKSSQQRPSRRIRINQASKGKEKVNWAHVDEWLR